VVTESLFKQTLLQYFDAGVQTVVGDTAVATALKKSPLNASTPVYLVAVGKAADAMVQGALSALSAPPVQGVLITKYGHSSDLTRALPWLTVIESAHPVPDEASLKAGAALVDFVQSIPPNAQLLVLMSGGASALVEHLLPGLSLSDLQQLSDTLLAGALPIDEMNRVRKTLSAIKGGKLASYLPAVQVTQLLISDVPGDKLEDIGSGLLVPPNERHSLESKALDLPIPLPSAVLACVRSSQLQAPATSDAVWQRVRSHIVASSAIAQRAVVEASCEPVIQANGSLHGEVDEIADAVAEELLRNTAPGLRVWGGETYLQLPKSPGRGGRNQHLALAIATRIAGTSGVGVLCCGTDGSDGPTSDAGGFVTGETVALGSAIGLDAKDALQRADAGSYLAAVGGLITTGPTGTNVMDLAIACRSS